MSSGDNDAQAWIDRGVEAYWHMNLADAAQNFEKAVALDPQSVRARLCFGVTSLFLYQNGVSEVNVNFLDVPGGRPPKRAEMAAEVDRVRALIGEQNATNGKRAEDNLQQALQLDPQNELVMEYLAALYYAWIDPNTDWLGTKRRSRLDEAKHWYERILEMNREHRFANHVCGAIDWQKAFDLMRSSGSYPRPLPNEEARRSLHTQISPLLDASTRNLLRAIEIDPASRNAMTFLGFVKKAQAYIAATNDDRLRARGEADEWFHKVRQILEAQAKTAGQPWPPGPIAKLTFRAVPQTSPTGKAATPAFPPDPQRMVPLAPPPPPLPQN
ncbi:MAG: hypothetical protein JOY54_03430 [Acidobacteriaceae bacterium]|nr:hypothetical protein [Acidobacteriaceae bacterium]